MSTKNRLDGVQFVAPRQLIYWLLFTFLLLAACQSPPLPTKAAIAPTVVLGMAAEAAAETAAAVPSTWTPLPAETPATSTPDPTLPPPPSSTPQPTATPVPPTATSTFPPTATHTATATATAEPPTNTPAPPPPTAPPPPPADPVYGVNLLPNPSFEEGHYNLNGIAELQIPTGWIFEWDEGDTGFGSESWDVWVRPEARHLSTPYLPVDEWPLFIWDGDHTMKIFKGSGAISFRLLADVYLEPGTYVLEINVFPDLVSGYNGGQKIWAPDPTSGEVRLIAGNGGTGWILPAFGRKNTFTYTFTIGETQVVRVGAGIRGRYALPNNGWFMDDWSLKRIEN